MEVRFYARISTMQRIITLILVHSCFQKDFQSVSYDLVRYSNVRILKGIGQMENQQCRKIGSNFECPVSMTSLNNFKECLRKPGVSWSCPFDEYTREVQVAIRFNRVSILSLFVFDRVIGDSIIGFNRVYSILTKYINFKFYLGLFILFSIHLVS